MTEYDEALDHQTEWASFWTSISGRNLFHNIAKAISRKRLESGEKDSNIPVEQEMEEMALLMIPILDGECYYWSSDIIDMVQVASRSLPDSWFLTKEHIPSASGFFWLAKEVEGLVALGWSVLSVDDSNRDKSPEHVSAIHLPHPGDPIPDFNAISLITFWRNPDPHFSKPLPSRETMYVGRSLQEWKLDVIRFASQVNADMKEFEHNAEMVRLFATMLSFIQQRIMVPTRFPASRAARRRAMSTNRQTEPVVNVIKLRSVVHHIHQGEGEPVDWQCRWIVRGHWREQWYPSLKKNQPIFISSYIKGPDDKPLRDPKRLFAVTR